MLPWMLGLDAGMKNPYMLVGPAYVHGIMYVEAERMPEASSGDG